MHYVFTGLKKACDSGGNAVLEACGERYRGTREGRN